MRTVEQQSVMEMLVGQGHKVILLTTCEVGYLHKNVTKFGVTAYGNSVKESNKIRFYISNLKFLYKILSQNNIDVVIAHQQVPAIIAGFLRKFKKFKLIFIRHNSDEDYHLAPLKAKWINKIANWLTPFKVAPSSIVERHWKNYEKVDVKEIYRINYGYNFEQYSKPNIEVAKSIRKEFPTSMLILSIARLVPAKQHLLMFKVVKRLLENGVDCKFICLGSGPLETILFEKINEMDLGKNIFLLGRKDNVVDYLYACDMFLHLSNTEASNSAIKEAALMEKPVIVCKEVGDFDDYIANRKNSFLVDKENPSDEAFVALKYMAENTAERHLIGKKLNQVVKEKFAISNVVDDYRKLLEKI